MRTTDTSSLAPAGRVTTGLRVTVQPDGADGSQFGGSISKLTDPGAGDGVRLAEVAVDWGSQAPPLDSTALVRVTVEAKSDALTVPVSAVRSVGSVKYVDTLAGTTRLPVSVETGVTTDSEVEIISGLTEGQMILSGLPTASSTPASLATRPPTN